MPGALSGVNVIELSAIGPVPFAAMMMADMDASIVRVDRVRQDGSEDDALSGFEHRGRMSIAIDLKNPQGVETLLRLIDGADVLLEGFRPGVMEKLGLGPELCLARNPRLVYGRMTGWGQHGPLAQAAGHDLNFIALSGALHAMGRADRPPSPPLNLVGDYGGGAMMLLVGVLAALNERHQSGKGQVIDAAMSDGAALLMSPFYSLFAQNKWQDRREANFLDGAAPFYGVYQCADARYISIGAIEPQFYRLLLQKCGINLPAGVDQLDQDSWPALRRQFEEVIAGRSRDEWCALLEGSDVCFAPVLSLAEAPQHVHNRARGTFLGTAGVGQPAPAPRFSRTPSMASASIAKVGEHARAILSKAGFSADEIAHAISAGGVHASPLAGEQG